MLLLNKHHNLSATFDHTLCAFCPECVHNAQIFEPLFIVYHAEDEFFIDHAVDGLATLF